MERVSYHRLARRELNEAAQYYDAESSGLGSAFIDEVERCTRAIQKFPESGVVILGAVRRRLVFRFPYSVLYPIKPNHIRVLAVMNQRRRPMYWVGRE
jgi:plasmid stabilization system protein ParE